VNLMERYEELRQGALGGRANIGWGLVVLKTRGMALWVRSARLSDTPPEGKTVSVSPRPAGDEVVGLLAGMIWTLEKEARWI
jgi:hypothetical protein